MRAQINHMAIISPNYPMMGRFYEAVFGLKCSTHRPFNAVVYSDGYAGINIIPKRDGAPAGLDHFGMLVDDVDEVRVCMEKKWPDSDLVKRPSERPFAAYSANDPDYNIFDLAQRKGDTRKNIYAEAAAEDWNQERYLNKFAIRTKHVDKVADFYMDVFELTPTNIDSEEGCKHLTDGRVTLSLLPWSIDVYAGMGVRHLGPEHFGFKVESIEALKEDIATAKGANQYLAPFELGGSTEAETRKAMFARWATGKYQMCDLDGTWIDITDE
jgi:catechol 2,3-dioxygenase-like lactoylglutathione lyase family enzyme